jgi:maltooligosyltrehalose trehalohydrolase
MAGWKLSRGATVLPGGRARFEIWAPRAKRVELHLPEKRRTFPMEQATEKGVFALEVDNIEPGIDYAYRLNGEQDYVPDPVSRYQPEGVLGPSRVVDPTPASNGTIAIGAA